MCRLTCVLDAMQCACDLNTCLYIHYIIQPTGVLGTAGYALCSCGHACMPVGRCTRMRQALFVAWASRGKHPYDAVAHYERVDCKPCKSREVSIVYCALAAVHVVATTAGFPPRRQQKRMQGLRMHASVLHTCRYALRQQCTCKSTGPHSPQPTNCSPPMPPWTNSCQSSPAHAFLNPSRAGGPAKASISFQTFKTLAQSGNFDETETPFGQKVFEKRSVMLAPFRDFRVRIRP